MISWRNRVRDVPPEPRSRPPAGAAIAISHRARMRDFPKLRMRLPRPMREIANAAPAAPAGVRAPMHGFWIFGFLLLTNHAPW